MVKLWLAYVLRSSHVSGGIHGLPGTGRRSSAYRGETGGDYDELLDELAAVCAADDPAAVADLYAHDDLKVPAGLIG